MLFTEIADYFAGVYALLGFILLFVWILLLLRYFEYCDKKEKVRKKEEDEHIKELVKNCINYDKERVEKTDKN